jgi:hypothetical protein
MGVSFADEWAGRNHTLSQCDDCLQCHWLRGLAIHRQRRRFTKCDRKAKIALQRLSGDGMAQISTGLSPVRPSSERPAFESTSTGYPSTPDRALPSSESNAYTNISACSAFCNLHHGEHGFCSPRCRSVKGHYQYTDIRQPIVINLQDSTDHVYVSPRYKAHRKL